MFISTNWIKDFVDLEGIDIEKLIYKFTMSTAEVEGFEKYGFDTEGVVVGEIVKVENVENSTKLHKVYVNIGNKEIISICGAPNVEVGMKIPFAPAGAKVQGKQVECTILDNMESQGVCLSEKELGFSDDHSGVMVLEKDLEVGRDIKDIIPLEDIVFEVDNKSLTNRPDLWGHYGIAREIAAITKRPLKEIELDDLELYNNLPKLDIKIEDAKNCFRYTGITIENVQKNTSPYIMKMRLYYAGVRSINLLADLTNYVMLEVGQPMHAFDRRFINNINVKSLKEEIEFTTLDETKRMLPENTLMITTNDKPVAIAGVMGGLNSEIKEDTNSVFLESATFDSTNIRKTAIKIGLRTDASARYEKSLDPELCKMASARFIKLLKDIDPNVQVTSSYTDEYVFKYPHITIDIDKPYFDRYIGKDLSLDTIVETLKWLDFKVETNGENLIVDVPSHRATKDVSIKADLVEEVARIYGYDNIEPKSNLFEAVPINQDSIHVMEYDFKEILAEKFGASEIHSYVWYNNDKNKEFGIEVEDNLKVVNSITKGDNVLRKCMGPTMLYAADQNLKYYNTCKFFEVGRTFEYHFDGKEAAESKILGICLASVKDSEKELMLEAKDMIDSLLKIEKNLEVKYVQNNGNITYNFVNPVNSYTLSVEENVIGYIALVHPKITDNINKKANIVIVELNLDILDNIKNNEVNFVESTKYQTTKLDITVVVDKKVKFEEIEKVIKEANIDYLLGYELVDIYENSEKLLDKKSVTLRFNIGSYDRTLLGDEINVSQEKIINTFDSNNMIVNK